MTKRLLIVFTIITIAIGARFDSFIERPVTVLAQTNTFCAANLACTVSAAWTFTGPLSVTNLWTSVYACGLAGTTWGDKVNTALASVPAPPSGIIIHISSSCNTSTATSPAAAISAPANGNMILMFDDPSIYWIRSITLLGPNSGITSPFPCSLGTGNQQNCPISLKVGNGVNPADVVQLGGTQDFISNVIIDGNKVNNPIEGSCIFVNKAKVPFFGFGSDQNCAAHGIFVSSSLGGNEASSGTITQWSSIFNNGDGLFGLNSADWNIGEAHVLQSNGITATVNTTNTLITATSGSWSTSSDLVGTMLRINNTGMCQVLAIPSTTTITVAAATCWNASGVPTGLGTQTGVGLNWGQGMEAQNFPTFRVSHGEAGSNNAMDGILIYGTSTGIGSNGEQIENSADGNNNQHDIEIIGSCIDVQTSLCSTGNSIVGHRFWKGNVRTVANTFDKIKLVDGGQNVIGPVYVNYSTGGAQEKAFYEQVESAGSRFANPNQNRVSLYTFNGSAGTASFIDGTANGSVGMQVPVFGGGNVNAAFGLFDVTTGAINPSWFLRPSTGNLQFLNNAGTLVGQWVNGGQFQAFLSGINSTIYQTNTNCAVNSVSPAACGSAASGAFVVPTTTTTYTVNTSAVTAGSRIFLFPMSFAGNLPSSPTCVAPAVTSAPTISAISAATSFTFALPSTTGQTCWQYWVVN